MPKITSAWQALNLFAKLFTKVESSGGKNLGFFGEVRPKGHDSAKLPIGSCKIKTINKTNIVLPSLQLQFLFPQCLVERTKKVPLLEAILDQTLL